MKIPFKTGHFIIHVVSISLYMTYEVSFIFACGANISIWYCLLYYIPDIFLFYVGSYLIPPQWEKQRSLKILAYFLSLLLLHFFAYSQIDLWVDKRNSIVFPVNLTYIKSAYRTFFISGIAIGFWNYRYRIRQANEINELKIQALEQRNREIELENAVLRARVDPHLLFNTLNFSYTGIEIKSPKEAKALGLLSKIMKFSLGNTDADGKVLLKEELEYINTYIELNQLLNDDKLHVKFKNAANAMKKGLMIPPIILIDFIQDVFKHGELEDAKKPAIISITGKGNELVFNIENAIAKTASNEGLGIGMENTRKRLQQHYPDNFNLNIDQTATHFKLNLKIAL